MSYATPLSLTHKYLSTFERVPYSGARFIPPKELLDPQFHTFTVQNPKTISAQASRRVCSTPRACTCPLVRPCDRNRHAQHYASSVLYTSWEAGDIETKQLTL